MLDLSKPLQLRNGQPARIICTNRESALYPLVVLVKSKNAKEAPNQEWVQYYSISGKFWAEFPTGDHPNDLVNIPEERWVNLYQDGRRIVTGVAIHSSEARAKEARKNVRTKKYLMTIKVEVD